MLLNQPLSLHVRRHHHDLAHSHMTSDDTSTHSNLPLLPVEHMLCPTGQSKSILRACRHDRLFRMDSLEGIGPEPTTPNWFSTLIMVGRWPRLIVNAPWDVSYHRSSSLEGYSQSRLPSRADKMAMRPLFRSANALVDLLIILFRQNSLSHGTGRQITNRSQRARTRELGDLTSVICPRRHVLQFHPVDPHS